MSKKSYIIRLYDQLDSSDIESQVDGMDGIVEDVDTGIKHAFHNKDELWIFMTEHKKVLEKTENN